MKVMYRSVAMTDIQLIGTGNGCVDVVFRRSDCGLQGLALCQFSGNG